MGDDDTYEEVNYSRLASSNFIPNNKELKSFESKSKQQLNNKLLLKKTTKNPYNLANIQRANNNNNNNWNVSSNYEPFAKPLMPPTISNKKVFPTSSSASTTNVSPRGSFASTITNGSTNAINTIISPRSSFASIASIASTSSQGSKPKKSFGPVAPRSAGGKYRKHKKHNRTKRLKRRS